MGPTYCACTVVGYMTQTALYIWLGMGTLE
jgi:hypothetical protein